MTNQAYYSHQNLVIRWLRNLLAYPDTKHREALDCQKARKARWNAPNIRWVSYSKRK